MKNIVKRVLATFLVVAIVLTSAPLSGLVGLELPDWLDFTIKSSATEEEEWNGPDYSDLTTNQYMSMLLLNHNYEGIGAGDETIPQHQLNYNLNLDNHSFTKDFVELCEANNAFMASVASWELLTFDPANITEDMLDEKGYYTAIIFNILDAEMKSNELLENLNNDFGKTQLSVNKSVISAIKQIKNVDLEANALKSLKLSALTESEKTELFTQLAQDKVSIKQLDYLGKGVSFVSDALSVCTTAEEISKTLCSYIMISQLGQEVETVLSALYNNCPSSNTAMKSALYDVYNYCSSDFKAAIIGMAETGTQIASYAFSKIVGEVWKSCVKGIAGGFVGGLLIGQAIGKSISNFCFSSDALIEQYYVMSSMAKFEKLMVDTVISLGNTYKSNSSETNADNFIQSVKMLFSALILDCDYVYDFVEIAQTGNIFVAPDNKTVSECKELADWFKSHHSYQCRWLTSMEGYWSYYEVDAPTAYNALFVSIEDTTDSTPVYSDNVEPVRIASVTIGSENLYSFSYREEDDGTLTITGCHPWISGELIIPSTIAGRPIKTIADGAFKNCTGLTSVEIPGSVTTIESKAFSECSNLTSVILNKGLQTIEDNAFSGTSITSLVIPNSVTTMSKWYSSGGYRTALSGMTKLKTVVFEDGMLKIPSYALDGCESVESVTLPEGLTMVGGGAFDGCINLNNIQLPESLLEIGSYAFSDSGLESIIIPNHVATIADGAFKNCTGLTSVEIPGSVTTIESKAFSECSNLTSVILNKGLQTIEDNAFSGTSITSLVIPNSVTTMSKWYSSGGYRTALSGMTKLKTVVFEDGMLKIPSYALRDCESVVNIIIPESVTSIGSYAFYGCSSVTSLTLSEDITSIGSNAFDNCTNLTVTAVKGSYAYNYCIENNIKVNALACPHTQLETVVVTEADCLNDGYEKIICSSCKEVISEGVVPKLGHDFSIEVVTKKPTCSSTGQKQQICATCGVSQYVELEKLSHTYSTFSHYETAHPHYAVYKCSCGATNTVTTEMGKLNSCTICNPTHTCSYSTFVKYQEEHPHYAVYKCDCGATKVDTSKTTTVDTCEICNPPHVCKYDTFAKYQEDHPHYAVYKCDCGNTKVDTSKTTTVDACEICNPPHVCDYDTFAKYQEDHPHYAVYKCECGNTKVDTSKTTTVDTCEICNPPHVCDYDTFAKYQEAHPHYAVYKCDCGATKVDTSKTTTVDTCEICNPSHVCDYDTFVKYQDEHPHYAVYKCECGNTKVDTSKTTTVDACEICNPSRPEVNCSISIQTPSRTEIRCKDGIVLHANVEGTLPEGAKIVWSTSNNKFNTKQIDTDSFQIISNNDGYTTITVSIVDADGNVLASDSIEMRSKAGFGDKIGGFFRSLFGATKIYES